MNNLKVVNVPPSNVTAVCSEVNRWFETPTKHRAEPYWSSSELGDSWKIRIRNMQTNEFVVEHLDPETIDGHTCHMFLIGMKKQCEKSFAEGLKSAAAKVYESVCKGLGIKPDPILYVKKE